MINKFISVEIKFYGSGTNSIFFHLFLASWCRGKMFSPSLSWEKCWTVHITRMLLFRLVSYLLENGSRMSYQTKWKSIFVASCAYLRVHLWISPSYSDIGDTLKSKRISYTHSPPQSVNERAKSNAIENFEESVYFWRLLCSGEVREVKHFPMSWRMTHDASHGTLQSEHFARVVHLTRPAIGNRAWKM